MIKVDGDLDMSTAESLVDTVTGVVAGAGALAVNLDLSGLGFLDSSGIRALLRARRAVVAQGGSLTVSGARGLVAEVLHITAVEELLGITTPPGRPGDQPPALEDGPPRR